MNILWILMMLCSIICFIFGNCSTLLTIINSAIHSCLTLSVTLACIYIFWCGIIQIVIDSGLMHKLSNILRPLIRFLFGNISTKANEYISINISANILGIGNASVPYGIKAMQELDNKSSKITFPMALLFSINCASLQLVPTTILSMRSEYNSQNCGDIIIPILIVSIICFAFVITLINIFYKGKQK